MAVLACAVALGGFGALATAGAEPAESEEAFTAFSLQGTHGYRMLVFAGRGSDDGELASYSFVYVLRKHGTFALSAPSKVTTALVEGTPTVTSLEVDFGRLGRISVQFKSAGRQRAYRPSCAPEPLTMPAGSYEGTVEFHGEEDFTDLSATSVAARPEVFINLFCGSVGGDETIGSGVPGARLEVDTDVHALGLARATPGVRELNLRVNENRPGGPVRVSASVEEKRGALVIERVVTKSTRAAAFAFDDKLTRARFSPGVQFAGRGVFQRGAKPRNRWHGNLTVDFPGRSNVHLTGPGLHATLVHARRTTHPGGFERLSRVFRRAIGG